MLFKLCENGRHVMDWWHCWKHTNEPPFLNNYRVDMVGFVDRHKVLTKRSAFLGLPSAQNGGEFEGGVESGRLKH